MSEENIRYIQDGDWVFEVKTVRAMRVDADGKPYSAIANCNLNGQSMYIDGLLTNELDFSKDDFMTFHRFCQRMGLDDFTYHRYHNGESSSKKVIVNKAAYAKNKIDKDKLPKLVSSTERRKENRDNE